jgi:hypothetical protein
MTTAEPIELILTRLRAGRRASARLCLQLSGEDRGVSWNRGAYELACEFAQLVDTVPRRDVNWPQTFARRNLSPCDYTLFPLAADNAVRSTYLFQRNATAAVALPEEIVFERDFSVGGALQGECLTFLKQVPVLFAEQTHGARGRLNVEQSAGWPIPAPLESHYVLKSDLLPLMERWEAPVEEALDTFLHEWDESLDFARIFHTGAARF